MHWIWIFYLGALTGGLITVALLALFAVGSRSERSLSTSGLFSEPHDQ